MDISTLQQIDLSVLRFFNGSNNIMLDQMAYVLTSGFTWLPLYVVLLYIVIRNNETMFQIGLIVCSAMFCVILADGVADGLIKPYVARLRPSNDDAIKYTIHIVNNMRGTGFSFFSAHAANTMSIAVFFALLMRSRLMTVMLLSWSLVNCWTRMYLGVHYPSDILCGLAWGVTVGGVVYLLYRRLVRKIAPDIKYISNQYTSTGYECKDLDIAMLVMMFILVYVFIRAVVMTCYI